MRRLLILGLLSTVFCLLLFGNDEFLERAKKAYGFDEWSGKDGALKQGVPLREMDFSPFELVSERHTLPTSGIITLRYGRDERCVFEVSVKVLDSVTEAQEVLLEFLASCTIEVPTGESFGLNIGDVCYAAKQNGLFRTIAFVRNNIFIRVHLIRVEETSPDISKIAGTIDEKIKGGAETKDAEELNKPVIKEFLVAEESVKANSPVEVVLKIEDPKGEKVKRFIDEGGGMVFEKDGKLFFKAEKPGEYTVTVYATNEHFFVSRKSVTIRVTN